MYFSMKKLDNKAQVGGIQDFIMAIVGIAVVLAIGLIVLQELQDSTITNVGACNQTAQTSCGSAYNATGDIITKLATVPTWIGILITVALAFIVLSFFAGRR